MNLQQEIQEKANQIFRDAYQMSIGELMNLYKDNELDIHPEFQRVFRWSDFQKTRLIESIMLNIPIPPIFVSQNNEGIWDVIDGVQRLSTIFEFVGIFKNENGETAPPLVLQKTDYLPSFAGVSWNNDTSELGFTKEQQLIFKRARIDVVIMKKESDARTKYDLFQRLNTGGTRLSEQEVRNCLMIMTDKKLYDFVENLDKVSSFAGCLPITDRKTDEQYRMELVVRLLVAEHIDWGDIKKYSDFSELLDKEVLRLCNTDIDYEGIGERFRNTFDLIYGVLDENAFKKFNGTKYSGQVMAASFQAIAYGVFVNIKDILKLEEKNVWLEEKIKSLYSADFFVKSTTPGVQSIPRYKELSIQGVEHFKP